MKGKLYNLLLILSSLFGFLEWGKDHHQFLFQIEAELFLKAFMDPLSILHPIIILPLAAQVLLTISLFQKKSNKILTYIGIGGIGILIALIFLIGCLNFNLKMLFSAVPFLIVVFLTIRYHRKLQLIGVQNNTKDSVDQTHSKHGAKSEKPNE